MDREFEIPGVAVAGRNLVADTLDVAIGDGPVLLVFLRHLG